MTVYYWLLIFSKMLIFAKRLSFCKKRLGFFQSWYKTSFLCEKFSLGISGNLLLEHGKRGENSCFWKWKKCSRIINAEICLLFFLLLILWLWDSTLFLYIWHWYLIIPGSISVKNMQMISLYAENSFYILTIIWNRVNFVCFLHSYYNILTFLFTIKDDVHQVLFQILSQGREWAWSSVCHSQERNLPKWEQQREAPLAETSVGKMFREGNCDLGTIQNKPW